VSEVSDAPVDQADDFSDERPVAAPRPVATVDAKLAVWAGSLLPLVVGGLLLGARWRADVAFPAAVGLVGLAALGFGVPQLVARLPGRFAQPLPAPALLGVALSLILLTGWRAAGALAIVVLGVHAVCVVAGAILRPADLARFLPVGLVGAVLAFAGTNAAPGWIVAHALFGAGFAMLGRSLLYGAVRAVARREQARVDAELLRYWDDARLFRVVGRTEAPERRLVAATESVRDALYRLLRLGATSLEADNAFVYFLEPDGLHLVLREQYSCGDPLDGKTRIPAGRGGSNLALALKRRRPVRLAGADISEHRDGCIGSLLMAPLIDNGVAAGVVVFDRTRARPFCADDEQVALAAADEIAKAVETERIITVLDEERREKARVFTAARAFGGVVREDEAVQVALSTALKLAPLDVAAFLLLERDGAREQLRVVRAAGPGASAFEDLEPVPLDPETWAGRAIAQGTLLPHVCLRHAGAQRGVLEQDDGRAAGFGDLRVIPLFAQGDRVGALLVAAPARLSRTHLDGLGVIADLAGVAYTGAAYFAELERMAMTDGLTGLVNRRTMDTRLEEALARADRTGAPLAVILSDIDHFKSVNDTYGHQVGDDVLVGVARTFEDCVRTTDIVARYGGEEFCLVLENTDVEGAMLLAQRIRQSIQALRFETELGPLEVTSSFGVAALGQHGDKAEVLVHAADGALYKAKERGRNRVELGE
jgi:diguanylate cyclase (GGDEF)-like protein